MGSMMSCVSGLALIRVLAQGRFHRDRLHDLAGRYGSRATQSFIHGALAATAG